MERATVRVGLLFETSCGEETSVVSEEIVDKKKKNVEVVLARRQYGSCLDRRSSKRLISWTLLPFFFFGPSLALSNWCVALAFSSFINHPQTVPRVVTVAIII